MTQQQKHNVVAAPVSLCRCHAASDRPAHLLGTPHSSDLGPSGDYLQYSYLIPGMPPSQPTPKRPSGIRKHRANSISNAVLQRLRQNKHVLFDAEPLGADRAAHLQRTASHPPHPDDSESHCHDSFGYKLSHLVSRDEDLPLHLPEFNKRPLTDTPIVSIVALPEHTSDLDGENKISHLSLADLDQVLAKARSARSELVSPTNVEGAPKALILQQIKHDLLMDIPPEFQQQFEKTPLFEELKDMLLSKQFRRLQKAYTLNIPGQTSSKTSPDGHIAQVDVGAKLVIVMVGLPARGKLYITNKLTRYLNWLQHDCRVFNVGNTRRMDKANILGPALRPLPDTSTPLPHHTPEVKPQDCEGTMHLALFFNPENAASTELREKWAMDTLDNLLNWVLDGPGLVGILDATNSTRKRRLKVFRRIQERSRGELKVLFLESICLDPHILDTNIRLKLSGPDYHAMDPEVALLDFVGRLRNYEKAYETIDDVEEQIPGFQYVKMIDVGKKVVSYNIQGFLALQTIYFLLNFNLCERQIWLTRHGESVDNLSGRIGGDSPLTKRGQRFAQALSKFTNYKRQEFHRQQLEKFSLRLELRYNVLTGQADATAPGVEQIPTEASFCVWTLMLVRAVETGRYFNEQRYNVKAMRMLNELGGGQYEGMTYAEIRQKHPAEYDARLKNKLLYRYPGVGGELYLDVLVRLRPLINELERTTDNLLIISHRVVLRVLLAYFLNLDKLAIVQLDVPLHTLYCLELKPYGTEYAMYEYDEAADWFKKVEPDHLKNVKEVGVNFRERKYLVIPTAPPRRKDEENALSTRKLADLSKLRKP